MSVHSERRSESPRARTLEDVARLAGVSRNTVSLAIRLSPRVNAVTRERVLRIVRETGYRPNYAARALAGRRTTTVGLVRYGSSKMQGDSFYDAILAGLRRALEDADYDLLLFAPTRLADSHDLTEPIVSGRVDGMVIIGTQTDREAVANAHRQGACIVHVGRRDFGVGRADRQRRRGRRARRRAAPSARARPQPHRADRRGSRASSRPGTRSRRTVG